VRGESERWREGGRESGRERVRERGREGGRERADRACAGRTARVSQVAPGTGEEEEEEEEEKGLREQGFLFTGDKPFGKSNFTRQKTNCANRAPLAAFARQC